MDLIILFFKSQQPVLESRKKKDVTVSSLYLEPERYTITSLKMPRYGNDGTVSIFQEGK
jgi:hypothetical protein